MHHQYELQKKAIQALKRINSISENKQPPNSTLSKKKQFELIFEEYSQKSFKDKLNYDMHIYDVLVSNIKDDAIVEDIQHKIVELYGYINKIYEHINIKPTIYGSNKLLLESEEQLETNAARLVNDFINKTYYSLTQEERDNRYKTQVINEAKDYILYDKENPNSAVQKAQKSIIYENLLTKVAFPLVIKSNIEDLMESEEYNMLFDVQTLRELYENFSVTVKSIASQIAASE